MIPSFLIKTQNKDLHCRLDVTSCVAMAVDIPLLLPIDEFLVKRHDMGKHALRFIIRMTTGVVYSIAMHVLLITAYALLTFQIFYTKDFDLVLSFDATSVLSFVVYLLSGLVEIVGRTFLNDQVLFTFFGHVSHMVGLGSMFLLAYNKLWRMIIKRLVLKVVGMRMTKIERLSRTSVTKKKKKKRLSRTNLKLEENMVMFNACSEMGVRMCAMDSSSRNAGEMLDCFTSHLQQDSSRFHHNIAYRDYLCSLCT
ncbi:hypothetical protein IGI04_010289 [Brassica rapa subsp. trilocularis]|uniref:Ion transport domain-containing protein n=1 Tax=Brassica rapa subsp. trilocularis TaxID=1813537 RepID=A0ABQ7N2A5_BRACM|nr:hypothetical protein IGI04_010289 [Brassica rapa subsp. trilocularis]